MCYDSVLLYVDNELPGFSQFCLHSCCPGNPEDEVLRVPVQKQIGWMVDDDYTNMEDVANDKEAIEFNNRNDNNQENGDDDNHDNSNDNDNNDNIFYSKVETTKKRKKGMRSKPMPSKKLSQRGQPNATKKAGTTITHQSTMIL